MPPQVKKSSLGASLKAHAKDPVEYGMEFTELPADIKGGIAQFVEGKRGTYKSGTNQGKEFLYLAGVVKAPKTATDIKKVWDATTKKVIIVSTKEVEVEGQRTSLTLPLCDTKGRRDGNEVVISQDENVANALNELRKIAGEGSTDHITDEAELDAFLESLKEAGPYFKFGTSASDPTEQYPEQRVWHRWYGSKGLEDYVPESAETAAAAPVNDRTAAPAASPAARPGRSVTQPPPKEPEPAAEYSDDQDLDSLASRADDGDEAAQERLTELANAAGVTDDQIAGVNDWAEVLDLMKNGGETASTKTGEPEEDWEPAKEEVYYYKPQVKGPGGRLTTAKKAVECEVTAVDKRKKTVALKNLTDNKAYKDVPWDQLSQEP